MDGHCINCKWYHSIYIWFINGKKKKKGTELYKKLLGFKEFIKSVEKDRLQEF